MTTQARTRGRTVRIPTASGFTEIGRTDAIAAAVSMAKSLERAAFGARDMAVSEALLAQSAALHALTYFAMPHEIELRHDATRGHMIHASVAIDAALRAAVRSDGTDVLDVILAKMRDDIMLEIVRHRLEDKP